MLIAVEGDSDIRDAEQSSQDCQGGGGLLVLLAGEGDSDGHDAEQSPQGGRSLRVFLVGEEDSDGRAVEPSPQDCQGGGGLGVLHAGEGDSEELET